MKSFQYTLLFAVFLVTFGLPNLSVADPLAGLKTFGTAGKQLCVLKGGVEAELFHYAGKGCLTHLWFGGNFKDYEKTRIRIYVDGETNASIDMELFLGHGIGFEDKSAPWGIARIGKTGEDDRQGRERK